VRGMEAGNERAQEMAFLTPYMSEDEGGALLQEALAEVDDDESLMNIIQQLPDGLGQQVLSTTLARARELPMGDEWRARFLGALAAFVPEQDRSATAEEALDAALAVELGPQPDGAVETAEAMGPGLQVSWSWYRQARTDALVQVIPVLSDRLLS